MPAEITQHLGFDASKAIQELGRLRGELNNFKQTLQSVSGGLRKFPASSMPAIQTLKQLTVSANAAQAALRGMASVGVAPAGLGASAKQAAVSMGGLATQTQTAAQQVSTVVPSAFGQAKQAMAQTAQAAGTSAAAVVRGANQTATAAAGAGKALADTGAKGAAAGKSITMSWTTLLRVVQVQLIVRALSTLLTAFSECQSSAIEFSTAVAEASTIAGGHLGPLGQMNASVLELSRSLGALATDVAEGTYQTLSNQVVEAADSFKFANEAAKLSIATNSELRSAVNALSSVMNSYNLDVSETGRVSDILFKTIELGRLRLSEFGDVLGRVSPLTAVLGIRYEEMAAAIAALTQKGVPAHTAITQLTQVSQKLLRPTEKLQELYEEWGVETGPEAIRRFGGLQGVLLKMKDATAGNDKEFADLLGRVRAMVGALNLTSNEANALTEALQGMEDATGITDEALKKMRDSVGRQATEAWNNLNTSMTEVGQTLLKYTTPMVKATDALVQNMRYLGAATVGVASGLAGILLATSGGAATYAGAAIALVALKAALIAMVPVLIAVAAALATIAIIDTFRDSLDKATEITEKYKRLETATTKAHEAESQQRILATRKEFEERRKATGEFFSASTKLYRKDFDMIEVSSKAVGRTLDNTLDSLLKKRQDAIAAVKAAVLDTDDAIKSSMEEVTRTQQAISDAAFDNRLRNMNNAQRAQAKMARASKAAAKAQGAYAIAGGDEEAVLAARALSHIAEKRAEEAVSQAEKLGHYGWLTKAEGALENVRADRIRGEMTFQLKRKELQSEVHKDHVAELEEEGIKLEEIAKKLAALADPLTSEGGVKTPKTLAEDAKRIAELLPQLKSQLDLAFDFKIYDKLGMAESMAQLKEGVLDAFNKANFDWSTILQDFQQIMSARIFEAPVKLVIQNEYLLEEYVKKFGEFNPLGDVLGKQGGQMDQVFEEIVEGYEGLTETAKQASENAMNEINKALERLTPAKWYTWLDGFRDKLIAGLAAVGDAQLDASGHAKVFSDVVREETGDVESLRLRLKAAADMVKQAVLEQKPLTQAQKATINGTLEYGRQLEAVGVLSKNMGKQGSLAFKDIVKSVQFLTIAMAALEERSKIDIEGYTAAKDELTKVKENADNVTDALKDTAAAGGGVKGELKDSKKAQEGMPAIALQVEKGLAAETDQASKLRTELEGARDANAALVMATSAKGTPGTPAQPTPEPRKISTEELARQALAARQLVGELITVDEQFGKVSGSVGSLTEAMNAPLEVLTSIQVALASTHESIQGINDVFIGIIEPINLANEGVGSLLTALNDAATATGTVTQAAMNWNAQLQGCAVSGIAAAQAMQTAASAAVAAAQACALAARACAGGGVGAAHGGRYFQDGGRGTDRIPVWLSAGEFVVNARSARNFFPQLQAINAGQQPLNRDQGGSVTNVGDINVTVQGGDSSNQTIRDIASGLRRELRRNTARLY